MSETIELTTLHPYSINEEGTTEWSSLITGQVLIWQRNKYVCIATTSGWCWCKGDMGGENDKSRSLAEALIQHRNTNGDDFRDFTVTFSKDGYNHVIEDWHVYTPPKREYKREDYKDIISFGTF